MLDAIKPNGPDDTKALKDAIQRVWVGGIGSLVLAPGVFKFAAVFCLVLSACHTPTGDKGPGTAGAVCFPNDTCLPGLLCQAGVCVVEGASDAGDAETTDAGNDGDAGDSETTDAGNGGDAGNNKEPGTEGAVCFPNDTCMTGLLCQAGVCIKCHGTQVVCDGRCVDITTNTSHCGKCGTVCSAPRSVCIASRCECPSSTTTWCSGTGTCLNTVSDPFNCGECGKVCAIGGWCDNSQCKCLGTQVVCDGRCVDTKTDINHCGECSRVCTAPRSACIESQCDCPPPKLWCGDACLDVTGDPLNCGECGKVCPAGSTCDASQCLPGYEWAEWALWPVPPKSTADYTVNDDTVIDNVTELIWQRNVPTEGGLGGLGLYSWASAKSHCAGLSLGGQSGWRLPTVIELLSIIDASMWIPAINTDVFPSTPSAEFWSATPFAGSAGQLWIVGFGSGGSRSVIPSTIMNVRCVRSAWARTPEGRYTIEIDTVKDDETGLTWQREVPATSYTWANAGDYCQTLSLGGFSSDWRLPTKIELETLIDRRVPSPGPTIDSTAFPSTPAEWFWSATPNVNPVSTLFVWCVDFNNGRSDDDARHHTNRVRCVR